MTLTYPTNLTAFYKPPHWVDWVMLFAILMLFALLQTFKP